VSKRKLLLADDSITIQKVVNLTFADEGIEVISVGDGDSAMRKFDDDFMPDLVMADVNMPGLSGYEVCRIIKATEETQHIPVILLVGSFEPFDEAAAKDAGADDFLTKPFQSIRQLVNKVTDLLNRPEPPAAQAETQAAAPVVDSSAETLESDKREQTPSVTEFEPVSAALSNTDALPEISAENAGSDREMPSEFGDAGMDDEMIEASSVNDYTADSGSGHQAETGIDYQKTQPLNAEDLKSFDIVSDESGQTESARPFENVEPIRETYEQPAQTTSAPPSFDEEARKMGFIPQSYAESSEDRPEISETEPEIDYYLPKEPEFDKELTDSETLEPEVSYEQEGPRTPDFSQATDEETQLGESNVAANSSFEATGEFHDAGALDKETYESDEPGLAEETRLREVSEGADALPEAGIDLSGVGAPVEEPEAAHRIEESQYGKSDSYETAARAEHRPAAEPETESEYVSENNTEAEPAAPETAPPAETVDETPMAAAMNAPDLDFDDGDLLELPPLVEETGIRPQPKAAALVPEVVAEPVAAEPESKITVTKTVAESEIALSFPPELIEAIAQKVAEKISAKALTEVLPQITEMVIRKLAEEKKE
jgi:DNA-binding response OmpR family regulator